jgi:hypothetical protein
LARSIPPVFTKSPLTNRYLLVVIGGRGQKEKARMRISLQVLEEELAVKILEGRKKRPE